MLNIIVQLTLKPEKVQITSYSENNKCNFHISKREKKCVTWHVILII